MHAGVSAEMERANRELFYNSAALYGPSLAVKNEIERAADTIKRRLSCAVEPDCAKKVCNATFAAQRATGGTDQLVFTSGATESNNLVIMGKITRQNHHLIVSAGEHSSVHAPAKFLFDKGHAVDFCPLSGDGTIDLKALERLVRPETALVVFGMVNSDTGCIQDTGAIVRTVRKANRTAHIHCDATQGFCKFDLDAAALGLDSVAISAHKLGGPKGIGALWMRQKARLSPLMHGGGQQDIRPGTMDTPSILGFARAVELFDTAEHLEHVSHLHKCLVGNLPPSCKINGKNDNPYITNIQLPGILGQTIMNALSSEGICVGLGSACASTATKNRTLLAMGIPEPKTKQVIRISFCPENTGNDVKTFIEKLHIAIDKFR